MMKRSKQSVLSLSLAAIVAVGAFSGISSASAASGDAVIANKPLYEVRTAAGSGMYDLKDGKRAEAAFRQPQSIAYDSDKSRFIVADTRNERLRAVDAGSGATTTLAGLDLGPDEYNAPLGAYADGSADKAAFDGPAGIAADGQGNLYVADAENHAVRKIDSNGSVTTIAGNGLIGSADGSAEEARFYHPMDVAVTKDGVVYVADTLNHVIRKIADGQVTTIGAASAREVEYEPGIAQQAGDFADGPIAQAKFNEPSGLALDAKGNLYVSDTGNQRIRYIDFASGTVTTAAGGESGKPIAYASGAPYADGGYADGPAAAARFHAPRGLAVTPDGGLLIADSLNHVIRYLKDGQVTTVAGTAGEPGASDGVAASATFNRPTDVAWIGGGAFAVADSGSNLIRVVKPYELPAEVKPGAQITLLLNAAVLKTDAAPVIINGTTFVPVRALTEKLGYKVNYAAGTTTLTKAGASFTVTSGSAAIMRTVEDGKASESIKLAAAPFIKGNRLYLPVRFFAEQVGLDVQWLAGAKAVLIRDKRF